MVMSGYRLILGLMVLAMITAGTSRPVGIPYGSSTSGPSSPWWWECTPKGEGVVMNTLFVSPLAMLVPFTLALASAVCRMIWSGTKDEGLLVTEGVSTTRW